MVSRCFKFITYAARKMAIRRTVAPLLALLAWSAHPDAARALTIAGYTSVVNDRFSSGYSSDPVTSAISNTDPLFVGLGYDWSGVGWNSADRSKNFGMISPRHFLVATHFGGTEPPKGTSTLQFLGANGQLYSATQKSAVGTGLGPSDVGDIALGTLNATIPASARVAYYPILDLVPSLSVPNYSSYWNRDIRVYGKTGRVATNTTTGGNVYNAGYAVTTSATPAGYESGDSGSPVFFPWADPNGTKRLALLGHAWAVDNLEAPTTNYHALIAESAAAAKLNQMMAPQGYALRWVGNASTTWTGHSTSRLDISNNWSKNQLPSDTYVAFAGDATTRRTLSLGSDQNLRGLIFTSAVEGNAFTFEAGYTLTLGRGGILNYAPNNRQTFACAIVLSAAQWWDGGVGGLSFTGVISNGGNLLIVDGPGATVMGGSLLGTGGLAKEGSGSLTLSGSNSFSGPLFVHNGALNLTGTATGGGEVIIAADAVIQGSGSITTRNLVVNGVLSPGDATTAATFQVASTSGTLRLGSTGSLVFNAGSLSDLVEVNGTKVVLGGTLQIVQSSGFSYAQPYPLFSGLIAAPSGSFAAVTGLPAGIQTVFSTANGNYTASFIPTTFAAWQQAHFTAMEIDAGLAADPADPDGDGTPNLLEYALGQNPKTASATGIPTTDASGTYLTFTVAKNPNATDLTYTVEVTSDLSTGSWTSAETTVIQDTATTLVVRDNLTIVESPCRFMRLRVTRQQP